MSEEVSWDKLNFGRTLRLSHSSRSLHVSDSEFVLHFLDPYHQNQLRGVPHLVGELGGWN